MPKTEWHAHGNRKPANDSKQIKAVWKSMPKYATDIQGLSRTEFDMGWHGLGSGLALEARGIPVVKTYSCNGTKIKQHIVQPFAANEACLLVSLAFFIGPSLSIRLKNHINLNTYLGCEGVGTYQCSEAPKTGRDLWGALIWTTSTSTKLPSETCPSFTTLSDIGSFTLHGAKFHFSIALCCSWFWIQYTHVYTRRPNILGISLTACRVAWHFLIPQSIELTRLVACGTDGRPTHQLR